MKIQSMQDLKKEMLSVARGEHKAPVDAAQISFESVEAVNAHLHNPAHPGEVLREWIPEDMTITSAAKALQVSRVTLSKVLNGKAGVTAGMALRLSAWLGTSPDVWLGMQTQWDLWQAEQQPSPNIKPLERMAALRSKSKP